jgi:hypothetical protein
VVERDGVLRRLMRGRIGIDGQHFLELGGEARASLA